MSFSKLLAEIEKGRGHPVLVTKHITPLVEQLSSQDRIYFVAAELDEKKSRGHFKRFTEREGVYAEPKCVTEVRHAKTLNVCWKRFVCCKELMHAFDPPEALANTAARFEILTSELTLRPLTPSAMLSSEGAAVWKAMAVLAPARLRQKFKPDYDNGKLGAYDVALALRIPEFFVPYVMNDKFPGEVEALKT